MQRHHINVQNKLDTLGLGFFGNNEQKHEFVSWETIKAESSETSFRVDIVDTYNVILDFKMSH